MRHALPRLGRLWGATLLLLALTLAATASFAAVVTVAPTGDGAGDAALIENQTVHPLTAQAGPPDARLLPVAVPAHGLAALRVQCVAHGDLPLPPLSLAVDGRTLDVETRGVNLSDGSPNLWIVPRGTPGRAALEGVIASVERGARVVAIPADALPGGFDGLRLASRILVSATDLAALPQEARVAIEGAVGAGSMLVIGAGMGEGPAPELAGLADVRFGHSAPAGPALLDALALAPSRRDLTLGPAAHPRLKADGATVVADQALGLGRVRVLSVRLDEVVAGPVARTAFGAGPDAVRQALAWLSRAPVVAESAGISLAWWVWAILGAVPLLGLFGRRWPRLALVAVSALGVTAVAAPPLAHDLGVVAERMLFLPLDAERALVVGTTDVRVGAGGVRALPRHRGAAEGLAIEDVSPAGGCLLNGPEDALWVVRAEPGEHRRLTWFAVAARPAPGAASAPFEAWPAGPLSEAPMFAVDAPPALAVDAPLEGAQREAWLVVPGAAEAEPPEVLPVPGAN